MLVALEDDLMFLSRIREAAKASGQELRVVRGGSALLEACQKTAPALVLVNLDSPRLGALEAVQALRADPQLATLNVVGYLSHVNAAAAAAGQAAGVSRVMARGAFVQGLLALMTDAAAQHGSPKTVQ